MKMVIKKCRFGYEIYPKIPWPGAELPGAELPGSGLPTSWQLLQGFGGGGLQLL